MEAAETTGDTWLLINASVSKVPKVNVSLCGDASWSNIADSMLWSMLKMGSVDGDDSMRTIFDTQLRDC